MKIEQIYTGCLAVAAYYIESAGEAAIIDPLREVDAYLKKAEEENSEIKYIFETHFHADFVSGHIDLAAKTGAKIVFGPNAETGYDSYTAKDGEVFKLGDVTIETIHTPGHTMESTTFLLRDAEGTPTAIFTGDTLFIGDVGRPDLAIKGNVTKEVLAGYLFDSLRNKIMTLPDDIVVYPGHGAGSACGKNMSKETFDTLGHQKEVNYALRQDMTRDEFIKEVTEGILPPPNYFPQNALMNKEGYTSFGKVLETGLVPVSAETLEGLVNEMGAIVLDTRDNKEFADGHIPNSIFIGIDGNFAPWVGALITDIKQPIVLIAEPGREEEVVTRLARVGYDNTLGFLEGGFDTWMRAGKEVEVINSIPVAKFVEGKNDPEFVTLDVRKPGEYLSEHVVGAENFPLDFINSNMGKLDRNQKYYVHCAGGYRSMIASSILKARGFHSLVEVQGGFAAIKKLDVPITDYVCPTTL
jgi:glyoxylase-like metal-dependent hydrolase (beta-lactamase superfamily II)/rhodanese-related sulfurtransferase